MCLKCGLLVKNQHLFSHHPNLVEVTDKFIQMVDILIVWLEKFPRKTEASKIAPIVAVMLPEGQAFEA